MTRKVLVVGHADADGHRIAEQVRRNLDLIEGFSVKTVVDPERTKDHKAWLKLDMIGEIDESDIVFFVDMMFAPSSFDDEAHALVSFVKDRPNKQFFLIDHHPLPARRLAAADNLRSIYRPSVFECAVGPRSGIMVAAAICENQGREVSDIRTSVHDTIAKGVRRAAALGGSLPGEKLLALLQSDRWDSLASLGRDDAEFHRLPRGRRPVDSEQSAALKMAKETADKLIASYKKTSTSGGTEKVSTAYDYDIAHERFETQDTQRVRASNYSMYRRDLEAIVTILEIAALSLTNVPEATFTPERLIEEARKFGGDEIELEDIKIVLKKSGFLKRLPDGELRLR